MTPTEQRRMTAAAMSTLWVVLMCAFPLGAQDVLVPMGATWSFLDDGSDQGTAWTAPGFADGSWDSGPAHLGYGDGDEVTEVSYGLDEEAKFITTYFRHAFSVTDPGAYDSLHLKLVRDDGAAVWLNGVEVLRNNLPGGDPLPFDAVANSSISGSYEDTSLQVVLPTTELVSGTNVLAVEVHQRSPTSSDISFDLRLLGLSGPWVTRGPYLQLVREDSVLIRWRTNVATDTRVRYGSAPGALTESKADGAIVVNHSLKLNGLEPDTTYYYDVGTGTTALAGGDATYRFTTPPPAGSREPLRIWVLGDSGTADLHARQVRDAYQALPGSEATDMVLMLGDNAYDEGFDFQFQDALFDVYPEMLRRAALWPTRGNHETSLTIYQNIFSLPMQAQSGGFPSGTESYYSFDAANVHFVCLDSTGSDPDVGGPMWTWADTDLASTDQDWIVAFWHHPPYSKGSHDSDAELPLVTMRENFLPLLESHGVDLVLCGHSHSYERSFLIDGHYGLSDTLRPGMVLDDGDGDVQGDGAYTKPVDRIAHQGAVYAVAGSSGKLSDMEPQPHPVMKESVEVLGSMLLVADGLRLTGRFLTDTGAVQDVFTLKQVGSWADLGQGLAGTRRMPVLTGEGTMIPGEPLRLRLTSARPRSEARLVVGVARAGTLFRGGTLVPDPARGTTLSFVTGPEGELDLAFPWPMGAPPGVRVWLQAWVRDPAGPAGWAATNALRGDAP